MWIIPAFISASLLGLYDVFKKISLSGNAVLPVLFLNDFLLLPAFISRCHFILFFPGHTSEYGFFLSSIPPSDHALLLSKAVIVLSSWTFAYFAIKHLPLTIASPIKATQPVLTLTGAVCLFGERLNLWQWAGISLAIVSLYLLSWNGKEKAFVSAATNGFFSWFWQ